LFIGLLLALVSGQSTYAQTPDGATPANEGICDPLKAEGVTKGLYGLCVAFCEAQDHADILTPITDAEYDELLDTSPSGRILANYLKKKTETDPSMPCIKIEEPCPCWTAEDLAEIDGVMWDGDPSYSPHTYEPEGRRCYDFVDPNRTIISAYEINWADILAEVTQAQVFEFGNRQQCRFRRQRNAAGGSSTNTTLRSPDLSPADFESCKASLRDFQANSGFCVTVETR
jgi:hypothetical protein